MVREPGLYHEVKGVMEVMDTALEDKRSAEARYSEALYDLTKYCLHNSSLHHCLQVNLKVLRQTLERRT